MGSASSTRPEIGRADRGAIYAILVVGVFLGGFVAGDGLIRGVFRLLDPAGYPIELIADIPVETGPGVVQAHGSTVVVSADGLSAGPIWLFAISDLIGALAIALVTVSFAYVLWRIAQRRPFHRTVQVAALVAGCAIALGSLLAQGLGGLAKMMAATELGPSLGDVAEVGFLFAPLPIIVGFGVLALAYVFQAGERLQRDTDGLV